MGGLPEALRELEIDPRQVRRGEVRLKVVASTVNVDDQHLIEGTMMGGVPVGKKPSPARPVIPGVDVAGVVETLGPEVSSLAVGDTVFGIAAPATPDGPWAERCVVKARALARRPAGWSCAESAALALAGSVAVSMVTRAGDVSGRRCLVIGASGGIGGLLVQVLTAQGAEVWGVCSQRNAEHVRTLGAARVVDYQTGPIGNQIGADRVDLVFDCVGGRDTEAQAYACLHRHGRFLTIVGPDQYVGAAKIGFWGLARSFGHIAWRWSTAWLTGPAYRFVGPLAMPVEAIDRLVVRPGIRPTIDREVPFTREAVAEALRYVASHRARGKVVIRVSAEPDGDSRADAG